MQTAKKQHENKLIISSINEFIYEKLSDGHKKTFESSHYLNRYMCRTGL